MNIFHGKKIRLRARKYEDIERDKAVIENSAYDTEIDRMTDSIYLPFSVESRLEEWENSVKKANDWDRCNLVIETLDGTAVGGISITEASRTDGSFSYGLAILPNHRRKGYAKEAIILILNYYFNELRFHKCNVNIFDFNEGSKLLHKSLGFIEEGRRRESKYTKGKYYDVILYGMTENEFRRTYNLED